jgi:phosphoglycerol transferase MdoB-like AlkP superfamily enzyme
MEIIFKVAIYKTIFNIGLLYMIAFTIPLSLILYVFATAYSLKVNKNIAILLSSLVTIIYISQLVYQRIFYTYYSLYSVGGAGQVFQFWREVLLTIKNNVFMILLFLIPLMILIICGNRFVPVNKTKLEYKVVFAGIAVMLQFIVVGVVHIDNTGDLSSNYLYNETFMPDVAVNRFGLVTSMKLDLKNLLFGIDTPAFSEDFLDDFDDNDSYIREYPRYFSKEELGFPVYLDKTILNLPAYFPPNIDVTGRENVVSYNAMDIDFESLSTSEKDENVSIMHKYFNSIEPTNKNKYTGRFKGKNLIMITAEGFSTWAIDPVLTPTLYKMVQEGFNFTNFYTPIWGVSTSDGEYVTCTGLIPKSGVWSFYRSGSNLMPFTMGNQFSKLGYGTRAYHNHSYTYYSRDVSHPNMGYTYKGVGNGLEIKESWPESDLEMINVTMPEFINEQPFHTYYMTVSGHLQYNFGGNAMAAKNKELVKDLPYSEAVKAYIACNIELDKAMEALLAELEAEGIAENTVISISPDHYPYGLTVEEMSERAGSDVETNFEMFHTTFILWNKGMKPTTVDRPCSSLDIMPTLSNLFGLEFDSRLFMGRDIFSDSDPLVIFSNRSWITDKGRYNSIKKEFTPNDGVVVDEEYRKKISKIVNDKFTFSTMILDYDYYEKVIVK